MIKHTILTLALLASVALGADRTFTTLDGVKYEKAEVSKVEPDGITVMYDAGIAKILFTSLPPEVQKEFGYDAAKGAAFRQAQQAAQAKLAAGQMEAAAKAQTTETSQQDQLAAQEREAAIDKRARELAKAAFKNWQKNVGRPDQGFTIAGKNFLESKPPKMADLVEEFKAKLRAGTIK